MGYRRPIDVIEPDVEGARLWVGSVRRVSLVEVEGGPGRPRCRVHGHGPRLPFNRPIPLSLALGLEVLGVPLTIRSSAVGSSAAATATTGGDR